ncbi:hypothetical protein ANANG_G00291920 [Anguilla anguilla]|uniref:Nuclear body protein SP140-like protein n=1 Tax=Anguilla anguilla TaxID=7936 RepID=A0A9D3LNY3_ANGAN|nr:hypothetical protein ANANG_G00291920 [Anguilla anguilla]
MRCPARVSLLLCDSGSPISKGVKEDIWTWPLHKTWLPITCGNKEGNLHRNRLAKGEECILAEGRWFTPSAFEEFGGKKSSKNWKMSICCQDTPLQNLIKVGHLKCPRSFSQRSLTSQSEQGSSSGSSSDSERPAQSRGKRRATLSHSRQSEHNIPSSPISKGVKEDIWTWPLHKTWLPITCGNKEGNLHRNRLAKGEECILVEGRWFTPSAFEEFGGKKSSKNWKMSVRCQDTPLQILIEVGHLKCPRSFSQRCLTSQSEQGSSSGSSSDSERPAQSRGKRRATLSHSRQSEHNIPGSPISKGVKEDIWTWPLHKTWLPITCGNKEGNLHRDKLAKGEECILAEGRWFTPSAFEDFGGKKSSKKWKMSICCQNTPLQKLIEVGHLKCPCSFSQRSLTSQSEQGSSSGSSSDSERPAQSRGKKEQVNDDNCTVCGQQRGLLCCDGCSRAFHPKCHLPTVDKGTLGEQWLCTYCVLAACRRKRNVCDRSLTQALKSRISDFMLECRYLLLQLYNSDKDNIFFSDPCDTVPRYREFIEDPMWLDKVAEKLQDRQYSSVRQFVSDIHLIFENCATFNGGNKFGQMGERLKKLFDEQFQDVFSVKN